MPKTHDDDFDPPEFVMSKEEKQILLPQDDLTHTLGDSMTEQLALEVLDGKWGSSPTFQRRNLIKAGRDARAVMEEVKHLS